MYIFLNLLDLCHPEQIILQHDLFLFYQENLNQYSFHFLQFHLDISPFFVLGHILFGI
jgi:hypothetical protein